MRTTTATADDWFARPSAWQENSAGNLCRRWQGKTLTLFAVGEWHSWAINDRGKLKFPEKFFRSASAALADLGIALNV